MKKVFLTFIAGIMVFTLAAIPAATVEAAYCGITWGSGAKTAGPDYSAESLTNIRTGRHECFDRMVLDLSAASAGYDVQYVTNVYQEGSGALLPLTGGAKLEVILKAPAYDEDYNPTYPAVAGQHLPGVNLAGYQTFRDAKFGGSFEGRTQVGLGVRAHLPFRVTTLDNRVIIDVAHYW